MSNTSRTKHPFFISDHEQSRSRGTFDIGKKAHTLAQPHSPATLSRAELHETKGMPRKMGKAKILVVDDEEDIVELVQYNLAKEGYLVQAATSGEEALRMVKSTIPDLVVLDLMLPGLDGTEVCKRLRNDPATKKVPIVMLTAKGEESDVVAGLENGADDYLTKPFSPKILIARVRALLRRKVREALTEGDEVRVHDIVIHPGRHEVTVKGKTIDLTATEFRIVQFLAKRPGWVFTRYQIVQAVHGDDYPVTDRSIDVQMVGLRKKLCSNGKYLETVRGVGYRFQE